MFWDNSFDTINIKVVMGQNIHHNMGCKNKEDDN